MIKLKTFGGRNAETRWARNKQRSICSDRRFDEQVIFLIYYFIYIFPAIFVDLRMRFTFDRGVYGVSIRY
jgi:hypothetical protein